MGLLIFIFPLVAAIGLVVWLDKQGKIQDEILYIEAELDEE